MNQDGITAIARAQAEVARARGWARHGNHERAAQAFDAALAALAQAETLLRAAPYAAAALAAIHRDLDTLTGGITS